ncbi:MAG: hypothetical protein LBI42_09510 [Chitinispirillales bacterium]|jgi:RHS repeat-associated protein|nr:hypothetical protein [Chitinispirillales bacterium]
MNTQNTNAPAQDKKGVASKLVAAPSIDLPKGGGALKGIEDKFQANPVTGSAGFSIPLPLSPSRGSLEPEIDLSYDSGSGNGPFGLGWSLSVPNISRKTDKGLPEYFDSKESDVFIMSGSEDLVPTGDPSGVERNGYNVRTYRPRIESGFARIERWRDKNHIIHWRTISADNITRIYGQSENARISDPSDDTNTFKWLLEFAHDGKGSAVLYKYKAENNDGARENISEFNRLNGNAVCTNRYLKSICYGNKVHYDGGINRPSDYLFELVFDYGEHSPSNPSSDDNGEWQYRPDPFSDYRAGFEIRTRRLCKRVLMFHKFKELLASNSNTAAPCLVRSVDFTYGNNDSDISQLLQAQQKGYIRNGSVYDSEEFPAMSFTYQAHEWNDDVHEVDAQSLSGLPAGLASEGSHFIDLYGEGLSGLLSEVGQGWYYKRNDGNGKLGPMTALRNRPFTGSAAGIQELEGNSEKYLVDMDGSAPGFYRLENGEAWTSHQSFKNIPNIDFNSPHVKTLDLDGDGRADLLVDEGNSFIYYRSEGQYGFKLESKFIKGYDEEKKPQVIFADLEQSIFLADMSGDGLTDIVRVRNSSVCYWPNLGHGRFGAKVDMESSPMMDSYGQFSATRVRLADVDGSGAADLIYIGADKVSVWLNKSGNGFTKEARTFNLCSNSQTQIAVLDFLGQGTACIVWSSPLASYSGRSMRYIDLMGGKKPYLMTGYNNGFGKTVELEYTPSTKFYLDDRGAGKPWVTKLPFPVHCLSKVVVHDHVRGSRFANSYTYHHGYYDIAEREFRGFGCVEQIDTEEFEGYKNASNGTDEDLHQSPVLTKTWYHLGAWIQNKGILSHYESEYNPVYKDESQLKQPELEDGWNAQETREAMRAFKGMALRQEVYALDGTPLEKEPYTTTQTSYSIRQLQAKGENRHGCYLVTQSESITHHYERVLTDPRIAHSLVLEDDKYGRPKLSAEVVYARLPLSPSSQSSLMSLPSPDDIITEQQKNHIIITKTKYAEDVTGDNVFRMGVECSVKTWELTHSKGAAGTGLYTIEWLKTAFTDAVGIGFEVEPNYTGTQKRLVEHFETLFLNDNLDGPLDLGIMASHGLPYESYTLSYTPDLLTHLYGNDRVTDDMLTEGGFEERELEDGTIEWWARTGRNVYDLVNAKTHFYLPSGVEDAFDKVTKIGWDEYNLLIESVKDPLNNVVTAENDYRTLSPQLMTDPNGNHTAVATDALGIVIKSAVMGKNGEGDTLVNPTAQMVYGFAEFANDGKLIKPSWVKTSSRETHSDENTRWVETIEYSDGMGEVILAKVKAEAGKWIGTGRTVLNNKGNPVKQYEPYFSDNDGWESEPEIVESGVTPVMWYDPLSRLIRTDFPDGTHSKVEFTAWEQKDYDQNDTTPDCPHYETPTVTHLDSLGRAFYVVANDGQNDDIVTRTILDIEGNEKEIIDARGNSVMKYKYGIHGEKACTESMDAGKVWILLAVDGQPIYTWDSRGHKIHFEFDELRRPVKQRLSINGGNEKIVELVVYGENATSPERENSNLRGKPWKVYDQSGMIKNIEYDFKGNLLENKRQLTKVYKQVIDWNVSDTDKNALLEIETFTTVTAYDALSRVKEQCSVDGSVTKPEYDFSGKLNKVFVKPKGETAFTEFVSGITYNPKGQREEIVYGNATKTDYTYERETFRLTGLKTTRTSDNTELQDITYTYDPVGNITSIIDNSHKRVFHAGSIVDAENKFVYDALYRLTEVQGREHLALNNPLDSNFSEFKQSTFVNLNDGQRMANYTQNYTYDKVGNLVQIRHRNTVDNARNFTKNLVVAPNSNRAIPDSMVTNVDSFFDANGNMIKLEHLAGIDWNYNNNISKATVISRPSSTDDAEYYVYNSAGERVRKVKETLVAGNTEIEEKIYLGGVEIKRIRIGTSVSLERSDLHVMDDKSRIAIVNHWVTDTNLREVDSSSDLGVNKVRYQYSNHLGSASLELNGNGQIISYEEYFPYGGTSFTTGQNQKEVKIKEYRYTGKERDDATGLYYHGARYYAPWLGRWLSCDPAGLVDGLNLYMYCRGNPVKLIDSTGLKGDDVSNYHEFEPLEIKGDDVDDYHEFEPLEIKGDPESSEDATVDTEVDSNSSPQGRNKQGIFRKAISAIGRDTKKVCDNVIAPIANWTVDNVVMPTAIGALQVVNSGLTVATLNIIGSKNYKDNSNYKFSGHIYGQRNGDAANIKMGLGTGDYNGCGWIATYNALVSMGNPQHPADIVSYLDATGGVNILGAFGTNPEAIDQYLKGLGYDTKHTYRPSNLDDAIRNSANSIGILAYAFPWGAHYVMIEHNNVNGTFSVYNEYSIDSQERPYPSIDTWLSKDKNNAIPISLITFR